VQKFSASHTKNPIRRNDNSNGMLRLRPGNVVKKTLVRTKIARTPATMSQRLSPKVLLEKKFR
jgi:hypothetical protein